MFHDVITTITTLINALWGFITAETAYEHFLDYISSMSTSSIPYSGLVQMLGACINLLFPLRAIATSIMLKLPVLALALILSLVYRVKSFIPTMGD